MSDFTVSVLITFYNQSEYVEKTINSVLGQKSDFGIELLCGDDGSTDGTYEKLLLYEKDFSNIKVFRMPRNENRQYEPILRVSENRKYLCKKATGEYLVFLDGDDYFCDETKLSKQVAFLKQHDSCAMCGHPVLAYYEDVQKTEEICNVVKKNAIISSSLYWSAFWIHAEAFLYLNVFKKKGVDFSALDDYIFDDNTITAFFMKYGKIGFINKPMVVYRQLQSSSWSDRTPVQKALVNIMVYEETKKNHSVPLLANLVRHYFPFKTIYVNRKKECIKKETGRFDIKNKFYNESINYNSLGFSKKMHYMMSYWFVMHLGLFIRFYTKLLKILCTIFSKKVVLIDN